jgi:hypothetical protein
MALEQFHLATLATLDGGRVGAAFDLALRRVIDDLNSRPNDDRARKLSLTVVLQPVADEKGDLVDTQVQFLVADNLPKRQSKVYSMSAEGGELWFNELSPDNVRQMTIDERGPRRVRGEDEPARSSGRSAAAGRDD